MTEETKERIEIEHSTRQLMMLPGEDKVIMEMRFSAKAHTMDEIKTLIGSFYANKAHNEKESKDLLTKIKKAAKRAKK